MTAIRAKAGLVGATGVLIGSAFLACNGVLGITPASVDPSLADAGTEDTGLGAADAKAPDAEGGRPTDPYSCQAYCELVDKNCTGNNLEYVDVPTCIELCKYFEPGRPDDRTNDTRACRLFHANLAANDAAAECTRAGPVTSSPGDAGGGCTDDRCKAFCALAQSACGAVSDQTGLVNLFPYSSTEACVTACNTWPYLAPDPNPARPVGDVTDSFGNSLNCRIYHLGSAVEPGSKTAPFTHCPHLGDPSATCN